MNTITLQCTPEYVAWWTMGGLTPVPDGKFELERLDDNESFRVVSAPDYIVAENGGRWHDFDDNGCCTFCGFDGADHAHQNAILRAEIGPDEYEARSELTANPPCLRAPEEPNKKLVQYEPARRVDIHESFIRNFITKGYVKEVRVN